MKQTTYEEFAELARRGTFVPVVKEIMADLLTPVSAFLKIAEHSDYAFLFESVEGGERVARYSFLGKDPFLVLRSRDGRTAIERSGVTTETAEPFVPVLRRLMAEFQAPFVPDLPRFTGGAVGFIGYDASIGFEPSLRDAWQKARWASTAAGEDESGFMLFDTVLAFDHVKHRILIVANARVTPDEDLSALYQFACAKITFLERELERGLSHAEPDHRKRPEVHSNVTRDTFESGVKTIKERIAAGDIYQAVLSQRFEADVEAEPFTIYRALRHVNPSPYMYFIRMGGLAIVGSSPEMLVRVEGRHVETHPIAGTRPRGRNDDEDLRLAEELKRNEKERAEHVMQARGGSRPPRRAGGVFPRRHRLGRAKDPRDADPRGAGADAAGDLRGRGGLHRLRGQPRFLHRHPHDHDQERPRARPGGRRHRRGFEPGRGVRGDARQGAGAAAGD